MSKAAFGWMGSTAPFPNEAPPNPNLSRAIKKEKRKPYK